MNSKTFPVNSILLYALDKSFDLDIEDCLEFLESDFIPGKSGLAIQPQRYAVFLERVLRFWVMCSNNIAVIYYLKEDYKKAIEYLLSAMAVRTRVFSYYLSYFHFLGLEANLSVCFLKDDRSTESEKIWKHFLSGIKKHRDHCAVREQVKVVNRLLYSEHPIDFLIINEFYEY